MPNSKPKVLFIMHMPPPVHGAAMVGKYIHDSKLVNESFDCKFENMMLATSLEDIGKGGVKKIFNLVAQLKRFKASIKEFLPDVVYVTPNAAGGAFYKDFVVVEYIKHCLRKFVNGQRTQVVVHYHNKGVSTRQNRFLDNLLYRRFFKGLKVILLADTLYEDFKKYVSRSNVFICPNGIPALLDYEPKAERSNDVPQILFLSNLIISKGVIVLLNALKILKDKGLKFQCTFVGGETDEMDSADFRGALASRNLADCAEYVGKKYGDEKCVYFKKTDIFAFPTFYPNETFGLVNLEAMEYKLPIVSTDEGGIPDVVIDGVNGLICKRNDAESLAKALEKLLNDKPLRERLGEAGYKKFQDEYTLEKFEERFVGIMKKVCRS